MRLRHIEVFHAIMQVGTISGAAQVLLAYFAARYALPGRPRQQMLATLIGGLLPMNLFISQTISNEAMSGCFTALSIVLTLRYLRSPRARRTAPSRVSPSANPEQITMRSGSARTPRARAR